MLIRLLFILGTHAGRVAEQLTVISSLILAKSGTTLLEKAVDKNEALER
jgi:hypothetical protein